MVERRSQKELGATGGHRPRPGYLDAGAPPAGRGFPHAFTRRALPASGAGLAALLLAALLLAALLLAAGGAPRAFPAAGGMPRAKVMLRGEVFTVDIANTPQRQARGLGGRARLGPREGMLFLYASKGRYTFWMKDMLIPIDIIWLENRRVVDIHHSVPFPPPGTPESDLPYYRPEKPANGVLEVAAGRAKALGLRVGHLVDFDFGPG